MNLENQVTSLELSQRLKELGVKQRSYFYWLTEDEYGKPAEPEIEHNWSQYGARYRVSAFTVAELGEMLPYKIGQKRFDHYTLRMWNEYPGLSLLSYEKPTYHEHKGVGTAYLHSTNATTEADARAKMLIYLIENKLITI